MNPKRAITAPLLFFVIGSVAYMITKELRDDPKQTPSPTSRNDTIPAVEGVDPTVIVYFFDQGKDCSTCDKLEGYAIEALKTHFPDELASGFLAWRSLDMDQRENEHFVTDFELYAKSIVIVRIDDGEQLQWENLEDIWDLVYDEPAYTQYIIANVREFLGAPS